MVLLIFITFALCIRSSSADGFSFSFNPKPTRFSNGFFGFQGPRIQSSPRHQELFQGTPPISYAQLSPHSPNRFSITLYQKLCENSKINLVVAPFSGYTALAIASFGARGETLKDLRSGLHLSLDHTEAAKKVLSIWQNKINGARKNVTLDIANKIYISKTVILRNRYQQITTKLFNTNVGMLDFTNKNKVVQTVNSWVDKKTHHKIQKMLKTEDIEDNTQMIILNTIYFNGKWKMPFDIHVTNDGIFYVNDYTTKIVKMMYNNNMFMFGKVPYVRADFIILPYEDEKITMTIVIPHRGTTIFEIERDYRYMTHEVLMRVAKKGKVGLFLPKFKIESNNDLQASLQMMNMSIIFDTPDFMDIADGITKVSKVAQKIIIEVTEQGTEAGASTSMLMSSRMSAMKNMRIDRPFLAIVRCHDIDLFITRVVDPSTYFHSK